MAAYYNEFDPQAAAWLRELIKIGHIADGEVDERSIVDVRPDELREFTQCHFFAGIGVWSHALRNAGWSDDAPVWTGSCPCQPFSSAGSGKGFADERHLWPHFHWLISQCRPAIVLGEQVASKDGLAWFDLVQADLEGSGYTSGGSDTCAAGFGAPHIRQRLYWVAFPEREGLEGCSEEVGRQSTEQFPHNGHDIWDGYQSGCDINRLAHAEREQEHKKLQRPTENERGRKADIIGRRGMDNTNNGASPTNGYWRDADWLFCRDGKWRSVEPGTSPLVDGSAARVGRLRGYGNAIVAPQATAFIEAVMECMT